DLFRDNVLWATGAGTVQTRMEDPIVALLDFESASRGAFVFDLAVTLLAWCYGDVLEPPLARALVSGYSSVRPLADREKKALFASARFAATRFTITRITDYAMPGRGGEGRVIKDWRRFLGRLDVLEAIGEPAFSSMVT